MPAKVGFCDDTSQASVTSDTEPRPIGFGARSTIAAARAREAGKANPRRKKVECTRFEDCPCEAHTARRAEKISLPRQQVERALANDEGRYAKRMTEALPDLLPNDDTQEEEWDGIVPMGHEGDLGRIVDRTPAEHADKKFCDPNFEATLETEDGPTPVVPEVIYLFPTSAEMAEQRGTAPSAINDALRIVGEEPLLTEPGSFNYLDEPQPTQSVPRAAEPEVGGADEFEEDGLGIADKTTQDVAPPRVDDRSVVPVKSLFSRAVRGISSMWATLAVLVKSRFSRMMSGFRSTATIHGEHTEGHLNAFFGSEYFLFSACGILIFGVLVAAVCVIMQTS